MKKVDALGKPCPIPVIEAKKVLSDEATEGVQVKVDNSVAVQNLEKMAHGYGYGFSYNELAKDNFEVYITKDGKGVPISSDSEAEVSCTCESTGAEKLVVTLSKNAMGEGSDELGEILVKGFLYSLTELPTPPESVLFFNSGVYLTSEGANTLEDLKKLEEKGTKILSCGTCINYFNLSKTPAVGVVTDMYGITEKMVAATKLINI